MEGAVYCTDCDLWNWTLYVKLNWLDYKRNTFLHLQHEKILWSSSTKPTRSHPSSEFSLSPLNFLISLHVFSFIFFLFLLAIIAGFPIFHHFLLNTFYSYLSHCQFHCLVFPHLLLISLCDLLCPTTITLTHRRYIDVERLRAFGTFVLRRLVPADLRRGYCLVEHVELMGQVSLRWKYFPVTLPPPHFKTRKHVMSVMFKTDHMDKHPFILLIWHSCHGESVCAWCRTDARNCNISLIIRKISNLLL